MESTDTLINNHNDYILDVKIDNFKNYLNTFIRELIKLEPKKNESNTNLLLKKSIIINFEEFKTISNNGQELLRQFNNIENKNKSNEVSNNIKLQDKITNLKKVVEEADMMINQLENALTIEKKSVTELSNDVDGYIKNIERLEELVNIKTIEILELKSRIDMHQNVKISTEYVNKLNDGNLKVISQKNEKILLLEKELAHGQSKILEHESKIKELEDANIYLEKNIEELSKKYKKSVTFADEVNVTMTNDLLTELKMKNRSLEEDILHLKCIVGNNDTLDEPLLDYDSTEKSRYRCNMCSLL